MTPIQTGKAYDQLTHLWTRAQFDRTNGVDQHRRAMQFVANKGKALDIGCGCTGRFFDLFTGAGFSNEGVDVSQEMVAKARQRNPNTPIHHADICQWALPHRYDFISAWDSIWHVPLEQQATLIEKLLGGLTPGGVLIFSFGGTTTADSHTDNNMGQSLYYATLGVHGFLDVIGDSFQCRHLEFDQYPELHAYMIVQRIMSSNA